MMMFQMTPYPNITLYLKPNERRFKNWRNDHGLTKTFNNCVMKLFMLLFVLFW